MIDDRLDSSSVRDEQGEITREQGWKEERRAPMLSVVWQSRATSAFASVALECWLLTVELGLPRTERLVVELRGLNEAAQETEGCSGEASMVPGKREGEQRRRLWGLRAYLSTSRDLRTGIPLYRNQARSSAISVVESSIRRC